MAYLQPYIGCVCLQGSAAPPGECPGIEGGEVEREEGGQRRKQKEWEKENYFFLKRGQMISSLCVLFLFCKPT